MSAEGVVTMKIRAPKVGRSIEVSRDFGASLEDTVELFGAETVHNAAVQQLVIRCQAASRSALETLNDKDDPNSGFMYSEDEAADIASTYMPGVRRATGGASLEKAKATVSEAVAKGTMTIEELEARIKELRAQKAEQEE